MLLGEEQKCSSVSKQHPQKCMGAVANIKRVIPEVSMLLHNNP